ncbi:hypothetical protein HanIR_Chr14g0705731 [Helianthus annuus]|nr:hypothetical protein HanIR_Chr14g0705731 [Helianthus annuus]
MDTDTPSCHLQPISPSPSKQGFSVILIPLFRRYYQPFPKWR